MLGIGELEEPLVALPALILLAVSHVLVHQLDEPCNELGDQLMLETEQEMSQVGDVSVVKVCFKHLPTLLFGESNAIVRKRFVKCTEQIFDYDKSFGKLGELEISLAKGKVLPAMKEQLIVRCDCCYRL